MDTAEFISFCDGIPAEVSQVGPRRNTYKDECVRIKDALTPVGDEGVSFTEFKKLREERGDGYLFRQMTDA